MELTQAWLFVLIVPAVLLLVWFDWRSLHPMPPWPRKALMVVRSAVILLALTALTAPAWQQTRRQEAVIFITDHSQSQGEGGMQRAYARVRALTMALPGSTKVGLISTGREPIVRTMPGGGALADEPDPALMTDGGQQTDLATAVRLAAGLFPPGVARRVVLVGDGLQTEGDLQTAAREATLADVVIDAVPVAGDKRPDVRVVRLVPTRARLHEGGELGLTAEIESSIAGPGRIRLFENGIQVDAQPLDLAAGRTTTVRFKRTPEQRNLYRYRCVVDGYVDDVVIDNDEAMTLVDVRGRPVLLYIEGEDEESSWLTQAMASEGIRLVVRPPQAIPTRLQELAGYDGIILSDLSAHKLGAETMTLIRDYVEQLSGGFVMIGGKNSFGVGGYYRTPLEDVLPVKMKAPDREERFTTALALVLDRSGSMGGQKIEICKSAAVATVELLSSKDYVGVIAFDSSARWVVPMTRVTSPQEIVAQIAMLTAGGSTNIYPGMAGARDALNAVSARVKHMIVLTDGRSTGSGYPQLAAQCRTEGMTISTVGIGSGADLNLLQQIAAAGGGQHYATQDVSNLPRIFTQDAMTHMGRLIREEPFVPRQVERNIMLRGWPADSAPPLLGYVKTHRKATAQVPLVTDLGDPLLATWRYGLGKVAAFTSDCKSRWAAMWIASWRDGYNQFWAQLLREVAREPQGQYMDMQVTTNNGEAKITVDLLADAAGYANEAEVQATVYFSPADAMDQRFETIEQLPLKQVGPGRYAQRFATRGAGVYLVRARSEGRMVSAGLVVNCSGETATGQVNRNLLEQVTQLTGGTLLDDNDTALPRYERAGIIHYTELQPLVIRLLILLFLVDVALRRWQSVMSIGDWLRSRR